MSREQLVTQDSGMDLLYHPCQEDPCKCPRSGSHSAAQVNTPAGLSLQDPPPDAPPPAEHEEFKSGKVKLPKVQLVMKTSAHSGLYTQIEIRHLLLNVQELLADRVCVNRAAVVRDAEEPELLQIHLCA